MPAVGGADTGDGTGDLAVAEDHVDRRGPRLGVDPAAERIGPDTSVHFDVIDHDGRVGGGGPHVDGPSVEAPDRRILDDQPAAGIESDPGGRAA